MDHMSFKANQTAAAYVAGELDELSQETFEIHMMGCSDASTTSKRGASSRCICRMRSSSKPHASSRRTGGAAGAWRLHSSARWLSRAPVAGSAEFAAAADLDSTETAIFDMQPITRSEECSKLPLAANTRAVVLRVTSVDSTRSRHRDSYGIVG